MIDKIASPPPAVRNDTKMGARDDKQARTNRAILLLNLGGPEKLADVRDFLFRLFDDPGIIQIKFSPLRKLIAWSIAVARFKSSEALYAKIGGGSPIRKLTEDQAAQLEKSLGQDGLPAKVRTAFSCSEPFIEDVVDALSREAVEKFLLLPLFPQYSHTTTKGVLARAKAAIQKFSPKAQISEIVSYSDNPLFLKAHAELIRDVIARARLGGDEAISNNYEIASATRRPRNDILVRNDIHILFSAHSIPEKLVTQYGDPYRDEIVQSVQGILKELKWQGPWSLSWQSKLGPVRWMEPSTMDEVKKLGQSGVKTLVVVPISFVTDHLETLYELDQLIAEEARKNGITQFLRVPGLNSHPTFIRCLASLAKGSSLPYPLRQM